MPAAIAVSKLMVPETGKLTSGELTVPEKASSSMDALTKGTLQGVELLINIIAMLVVLVALVYLANLIFIMAPIVWLMGVPWEEATGAVVGIIGS